MNGTWPSREGTEGSVQRECGSTLVNIWNTTKDVYNNSSELENHSRARLHSHCNSVTDHLRHTHKYTGRLFIYMIQLKEPRFFWGRIRSADLRLRVVGRENSLPPASAGFFLAYTSTLKMETIYSFDVSGFLWTTRRYNQDHGTVCCATKFKPAKEPFNWTSVLSQSEIFCHPIFWLEDIKYIAWLPDVTELCPSDSQVPFAFELILINIQLYINVK
jgi:hypothetical protein